MSIKIRNILVSLIILCFLLSGILVLSAKEDRSPGIFSAFYFWLNMLNLVCFFGAIIVVMLRLLKIISKNNNILYSLLATANTLLGVGGICLYVLHKINISGLHELLSNLLVGILLFADIFLWQTDGPFSITPRQRS